MIPGNLDIIFTGDTQYSSSESGEKKRRVKVVSGVVGKSIHKSATRRLKPGNSRSLLFTDKRFLTDGEVLRAITSQRPDFRTSTPLKDAFFGCLWRIKITFRCESFVSNSEGYSRLKTTIRVL